MAEQPHPTKSKKPPLAELSPALRAALIDPAAWQSGLDRYARAMDLAVALVSEEGPSGEIVHPRPTWELFHAQAPVPAGLCPFGQLSAEPCRCVANVLAGGDWVLARDRAGLVHFAVPLMLQGRTLGALVAGQVFDQFPNQAMVEHLAAQYGLSDVRVWQKARLEVPIKKDTLRVYGDLLLAFGSSLLQSRYHAMLEAERVAELTRLSEQLRRQTQELAEADRHKNEFLATLAHELRNPLSPIRNALQLLRLAGNDAAIREQAGVVMERQVRQLVRLIDDLLDLARINRGRIELRREHVELAAVVAGAVESCRPLIEQQGHELTVTLLPEPVYLDADPIRLAQVFANLLTNAAKYTEDKGRIWLTARLANGRGTHPDEVVVSVKDTGIGIPADMLPKIFDMFTQVNRSLGRAQGGLGIGLTLVKRFVEMHGGSVTARSAGPGHGSEFVVRLRTIKVNPTHEPPEQTGKEGPPGPAPKQRILVVDDNTDAASSLATLLTMLGHEVRTARDGQEGVALAGQFRPQVILMDVGMPNLNGLEATRRIRERTWGKDMHIIALTGWGQDADRQRSAEAGCNGHLVKPVDPAALETLLAAPLNGNTLQPRFR